MILTMKKLLTMQKMSASQKTNINVSLPIISALGIETSIIPTAIFNDVNHDFTDSIQPIIRHHLSQGFTFNTVYLGEVDTVDQLDIANVLFDSYKNSLKILNPVLIEDSLFIDKMRDLCKKVDVITPTLSESYKLSNSNKLDIAKELAGLGNNTVIIMDNDVIHTYISKEDKYMSYKLEYSINKYINARDILVSTISALLTKGYSLEDSITISTLFLNEAIKVTPNSNTINYELALPKLLSSLSN